MTRGTRPDLAILNKQRATHGASKTSTYWIWRSMRQRCENKNRKDFVNYGGRGIRVCEQWQTFEGFVADMGTRPDGMTLERVEQSGNYEPGNCKWATPKEQARNRRSSVLLTFQGRTATIAEWSESVGIESKTIGYRIRAGWPAERALTTPSTTNRKARNV